MFFEESEEGQRELERYCAEGGTFTVHGYRGPLCDNINGLEFHPVAIMNGSGNPPFPFMLRVPVPNPHFFLSGHIYKANGDVIRNSGMYYVWNLRFRYLRKNENNFQL